MRGSKKNGSEEIEEVAYDGGLRDVFLGERVQVLTTNFAPAIILAPAVNPQTGLGPVIGRPTTNPPAIAVAIADDRPLP
jgi:hypothetical protein